MGLVKLARLPGNTLLKLVLGVYVCAFLAAFWNHAIDLVRYGLFPYSDLNPLVPQWLNAFWCSLTIIDPVSIVILFFNIELGTIVYLAVILSNVLINFGFGISNYGLPGVLNFFQISQLVFLLFVAVTIVPIHRQLRTLKQGEKL